MNVAVADTLEQTSLQTAVSNALLEDEPQLESIQSRVEESHRLSPDGARHFIYSVVAEVNRQLFPPITKLELIHTEGCNLACEYCFEKEMLGWRKMPREIGRRGLDLLFDYSYEEPTLYITHFGGEPMLNFDAIRELTLYAEEQAAQRGKQLEFTMTSNGIAIREAMAEFLAEHRIMVLLSVDGLEETHDRYRVTKAGRGTFKYVVRALKLLKQTQGWVGVKMTVMPENAARLYEDALGLRDLGVNQFVIGYATGIEWSDGAMQTYVEQWQRLYEWSKANPSNDLRFSEFEDFEEQSNGAFFGCQAGRNSMTVAVNGEVSPCSKILALNNRKLYAKLGDVKYGLTHIRNRAELVTAGQIMGACERLSIADTYQGGCWASNVSDTGDLFTPSLQDHRFTVLQRNACAGCSSCSH